MAGGLISPIIPGIILSLSLSFAFIAIVFDDESALARAQAQPPSGVGQLVAQRWPAVSVPVVIVMILYLGLGIAFGASLVMSDGKPASDVSMTATLDPEAAIGGITAPLIYSIMIAQYHDLKLRKEGRDLAARLA